MVILESQENIQQFYKIPQMNILSAQEMKQAEQLFAALPIDPIYKLKLPADKEYPTISNFQSHIFPHTTTQIHKSVQKLITLSDNMRSLPQLEPNSPFYMLTYALISILYQDKYSASSEAENNLFLLETIKCSLYSKDLDMKIIRNAPLNYETKQLKLMAYRFFSFMEQPSLGLKTSRNKCAQWILSENPLLLLTFTLFLRVILSKIGIEEADDFKKCVSSEQAVTNLVEYFDLHYRSLGDLILFYQDGIFLALVEKEIVVGEYYLNENEKQNQKQQLEIKQSVKLNMIESFLLNVDDKVEASDSKKKGIVQSDMKLFNFMLESSCSDDDRDELTVPKGRESEIQTPYFDDNNGQLNFYKNKKSGIFEPEPIKNEIHRLILDNSEEYNKDEEAAPTPYLGGEKQFAFISSFPLQVPTIQITGPPTIQITGPPEIKAAQSKIQESTHKSVEFSGLKKTVLENEKRMMFTSAMSQPKMSKQFCASTQSEKRCLQSSTHKREQKVLQRQEMGKCSCRKSKLMRNGLVSKVVEVSVVPSRSYSRQGNMANTMGAKYSQNYKFNIQLRQKQDCFSRQRVKQTVSKLEQKNYLERKPAFLKNLKKKQTLDPEVIHHQTIKQDCSKSLAGQDKKQYFHIPRNVSQERIKLGTLPDRIEEILDSHITRSMPKIQKQQSLKEGERQENNEKMFTISSYRSVVAKRPWQTNSNLIQKVPEYSKISKIKASDIFGPNERRSSTSPIKFFAPVQIIAPTVFVNSNHGNTDHVVFKLQEKNSKRQANPELNSDARQLANKVKAKTDVYHHRHF